MVENKASEQESPKEKAESRYEDKDRRFNRHVMDELYSNGVHGDVSLNKVFAAEKNARTLTFTDLPEVAGSFANDSPAERKAKSFIYSETAKENIDDRTWAGVVRMDESRLVGELGAAQLADLEEAKAGKGRTLNQWDYDFRKSYSDAASVATTYGIAKGVVALTEHAGLVGAGLAAAYVAGGALNNVLAGREMTDFSGYVRNAGAFVLMNSGAQWIKAAEGTTISNYGNGFLLGSGYKSLDYLTGEKPIDGRAASDVLFAGINGGFMVGLAGNVAKGAAYAWPALATKDSSLLLSITGVGTNAFFTGTDAYQKKAFLEDAWQKTNMVMGVRSLENNAGDNARTVGQAPGNLYGDAVAQQRTLVEPNAAASVPGDSSKLVKVDTGAVPAPDAIPAPTESVKTDAIPAPTESVNPGTARESTESLTAKSDAIPAPAAPVKTSQAPAEAPPAAPAASQFPTRVDLPNYSLTKSNSMGGLAQKSFESIFHDKGN